VELLLARTNKEAHVHMELNPCRCGDPTRPTGSAVFNLDGVLASHYSGTCPTCGTAREFLFRLPEEVVVVPPGTVAFGDGAPSELVDPGEWLLVSDRYAAAVPSDPAWLDGDARGRARRSLQHAVAALDEVLAFLPDGADAVPVDAFRTERGRKMWATEPGRFSRLRLGAVRGAYGEMLEELGDAGDAGEPART
jgi:hypothetical protein